ncbi:hypothetical protein [Paenibacillus sp. FSL M7-1046]|uniref:hypothetical protein n=1 Tax=Paenibacillus sp. FSL M7-1046 TaxID=2975315 RepID=UPI0030F831B2
MKLLALCRFSKELRDCGPHVVWKPDALSPLIKPYCAFAAISNAPLPLIPPYSLLAAKSDAPLLLIPPSIAFAAISDAPLLLELSSDPQKNVLAGPMVRENVSLEIFIAFCPANQP